MAENYIIRVTAGSSYDPETQTEVPVNAPAPLKISNDFLDAELCVRVQNYHGLPRKSPTTSPYFSQEPHAYNKDQYSIAFRFSLKKPASAQKESGQTNAATSGSTDDPDGTATDSNGVSGTDLQFGNDFDHPIRDRLPPGFSYAMNVVKWWIDPGLEGDAYADEPYLYGPALSSFNAVHVGSGEVDPKKGGLWFEEGGDDAGLEAREAIGAPVTAKERMKWALKKDSKENWVFEYGKTYCVDFFNPYLDFNDFSLKLPGITLPLMKYWDGQGLRYVLRNRSTNDTYLVILFSLYLKEDVNDDGSLKPAAIAATKQEREAKADRVLRGEDHGDHAAPDSYEEADKHFEKLGISKSQTTDDDVD